jgi:hypothetical protein
VTRPLQIRTNHTLACLSFQVEVLVIVTCSMAILANRRAVLGTYEDNASTAVGGVHMG